MSTKGRAGGAVNLTEPPPSAPESTHWIAVESLRKAQKRFFREIISAFDGGCAAAIVELQ